MATAVQVESIWNGLTDNSGEPLASGKVYTYYAGTSTPVALFTASDKSTSATNPLILDGNGKAQVWADGRYKFVVKSAADVTLYTLDNLLYGFDDSTVLWGGQSTGSANAQTVSVPATVGVYANGQRVSFIAGYTNSGAVTLRFNSLAPVSVVKGPDAVSLQAGDIKVGQLIDCVYEAYSGTGRFRLEGYPTLADVQRSRFQVATNVSANSATVTADLTPALTSYEAGLAVRLKIVTTSSGPVTLTLNGVTPPQAVQYNNAALVAGELQANYWHELVYDGTQFQLLNPAMSASTRTLPIRVAQIQDSAVVYGGTSTGTANAQAINLSPDITAYTVGQRFIFKAGFTNTGATTLAVDGITPAVAVQRFGAALVGGEIRLNDMVEVVYDGTAFQLDNSTPAPLFVDRTNNRVGIGTTAPSALLEVARSGSGTDVVLAKYESGAQGAIFHLQKSKSSSIGTNTIVANGDALGEIYFNGANGSGYTTAATIVAQVDGTPGATNDMPGRLVFSTTADGAGVTTERMRITNAGRVGIGTTAPTAFTHIANPTNNTINGLNIEGTTAGDVGVAGLGIIKKDAATTTSQVFVQFAVNGGIGNGQINANGVNAAAFGSFSDARLKENIVDLPSQIESIYSLRPVKFDYKNVSGYQVGFIAQEVQAIYPDLVGESNGYLTLTDMNKNDARLIKAFQELYDKVKGLESRIAALET